MSERDQAQKKLILGRVQCTIARREDTIHSIELGRGLGFEFVRLTRWDVVSAEVGLMTSMQKKHGQPDRGDLKLWARAAEFGFRDPQRPRFLICFAF